MNRLFPFALGIALALSGCATFDRKEVSYLRSTGIPAVTLVKLERGRPITGSEVIVLHERGVPDAYVLRHLKDHGVDYVVTKSELRRMRRAGVSPAVIDEFIFRSEDFAEEYLRPNIAVYDEWYYDPMYPGPRLYSPFWW